jgi:hypothetical protein
MGIPGQIEESLIVPACGSTHLDALDGGLGARRYAQDFKYVLETNDCAIVARVTRLQFYLLEASADLNAAFAAAM